MKHLLIVALLLLAQTADCSITVLMNRTGGPPPLITLTYPNGGVVLQGTIAITWNTDGFGSDTIKIEMSRNNGAFWTTLFASTPNDESENWPVTLPSSGSILIRVCGVSNSVCDTSDAVSRIRGRVI